MVIRLARLASLLMALASFAPPSSAEPVAAADISAPELREETWGLPLALPSIAYVVRPVGKGPFPLVVMNHGVEMDPDARGFFPLIEFRDAAFWFARRGYFVVVPAGPGYGAAGLDIPEKGLYGAFFSKIGKCTNPNFRDAGLMIAKYDLEIIDYLIAEKAVLPDNVVVVGQSAGGWGSIALASQNVPNIKAVIVFAGGRGGRVNRQPNNNCAPDKLVEATAAFGQTARVPMLWIYARNDTYFGPDLSSRMHQAFIRAGGDAEYHLLDPFGSDGHFLLHAPKTVDLWSPLVSQFLDRHLLRATSGHGGRQ